jgi:hypothetical protein
MGLGASLGDAVSDVAATGTDVALGLAPAIETAVEEEGPAGGVVVRLRAGVGDSPLQAATNAAVMRVKSRLTVDDTRRF